MFITPAHHDILAMVRAWRIGDRPVLVLTGDGGTGKTTFARKLAATFGATMQVGLLDLGKTQPTDLRRAVPEAFGSDVRVLVEDPLASHDRFMAESLASGRRRLLIVDEAQHLSGPALTYLEQLTTPPRSGLPVFYVVLIGAPGLDAMPAQPDHPALHDRIGGRLHLSPFTEAQTAAYVDHRLRMANCACPVGDMTFDSSRLELLHEASGGRPKIINRLVQRYLFDPVRAGVAAKIARPVEQASPAAPVAEEPAPLPPVVAKPAPLPPVVVDHRQAPLPQAQVEDPQTLPRPEVIEDRQPPLPLPVVEDREAPLPQAPVEEPQALPRPEIIKDRQAPPPPVVVEDRQPRLPPAHVEHRQVLPRPDAAREKPTTAPSFVTRERPVPLPPVLSKPAPVPPVVVDDKSPPRPAAAKERPQPVPARNGPVPVQTAVTKRKPAALQSVAKERPALAQPAPPRPEGRRTLPSKPAAVPMALVVKPARTEPSATPAPAARPSPVRVAPSIAPPRPEPVDHPERTRGRGLHWGLAGAAGLGLAAAAVMVLGPTADQPAPMEVAAPAPVAAPAAEPAPPAPEPTPEPVAVAPVPEPAPEAVVPPPVPGLRGASIDPVPDADALLTEALVAGGTDPEQAAQLYTRAALWGNARAAYYLGQLYETGIGVPQNPDRARAAYALALEVDGAAARLDALEGRSGSGIAVEAAPVPVSQMVITTGQTELHWRDPEGAVAAQFLVEFVPAGESEDIRQAETVLPALLLAERVTRWRVSALGPDGSAGTASEWSYPDAALP
ncbi:AAA family ATPase [Paracoccus liaowanqingii]|nr:AAA family ATPase [Paracoccus liaowanqingii]